MNRPIRIFVGFDPRQIVSYTTLATSIIKYCTKPFAITPLIIQSLPIERQGLTPFTYTRFLVPWLCDFEGWALFLDADMMFMDDPSKLWQLRDDKYAVMAASDPKYQFERASMMLFNCGHPDNKVLTPEYIDAGTGKPHWLDWTEHVGTLSRDWNVLLGYQDIPDHPRLLHFTQGVPAFPETQQSPYRDEWAETAKQSMMAIPYEALMGPSVHVKRLEDGRVVPHYFDPAKEQAA